MTTACDVPVEPFLTDPVAAHRTNRVAWTMADLAAGAGARVLVGLPHAGEPLTVASLDAVTPVTISWAPDGECLAFAQSRTLHVWRSTGLATWDLPSPARHLAWSARRTIIGLSGDILWRCSIARPRLDVLLDGVTSFCVSPVLAAVRSSAAGPQIVYIDDAAPIDRPWPLALNEHAAIGPSGDDRHVLVYGDARAGPLRRLFEIARCEVRSGEAAPVFRAEAAFGVGNLGVAWRAWGNGGLLLACERDEHARLVMVRPGSTPTAISPDGFEVEAIAASPRSGNVAILGAPIVEGRPCVERWLLAAEGVPRAGATYRVVERRASSAPAWNDAGDRLYYAAAHGCLTSRVRAWTPRASGVDDDLYEPDAARAHSRGGDVWLGPRPSSARAAIVHVQGPHRRFLDGPQPNLYHHALMSLAHACARRGCSVLCVNGPGATGAGRRFREPAGSWLDIAVGALRARLEALRTDGVRHVAMVAGSLGSLPVLRLLMHERLAAAVLVAPVYRTDLPVLDEWRSLFEPAMAHAGVAEMAQAMTTPLLVLHGLNDEVSPAADSSRFVARVRPDVPCEYVTFPDESHVFRSPGTWCEALSAAYRFLADRLELGLAAGVTR